MAGMAVRRMRMMVMTVMTVMTVMMVMFKHDELPIDKLRYNLLRYILNCFLEKSSKKNPGSELKTGHGPYRSDRYGRARVQFLALTPEFRSRAQPSRWEIISRRLSSLPLVLCSTTSREFCVSSEMPTDRMSISSNCKMREIIDRKLVLSSV